MSFQFEMFTACRFIPLSLEIKHVQRKVVGQYYENKAHFKRYTTGATNGAETATLWKHPSFPTDLVVFVMINLWFSVFVVVICPLTFGHCIISAVAEMRASRLWLARKKKFGPVKN